MRWHINTYWPNGTIADSSSFDTKADAEARLEHDRRRDEQAHKKALVKYGNELLAFILDVEDPAQDREPKRPVLNPMCFVHKIEPCDGVRCIACHEAGYDDGVTVWA